MGRNQYWAGRVYDLCVYYMTGTPEGSTESGFMEKPGIKPATPGLQGIAGASRSFGEEVISCLGRANVHAFHETPSRIHTELTFINH